MACDGVPETTTVVLSDPEVRELVKRRLEHSGRRIDLSFSKQLPRHTMILSGGLVRSQSARAATERYSIQCLPMME